jgi:ATP-dependent Clp protease ATP-binding subunit ClpC
MTSNVGAELIRRQMSLGFAAKKETKEQKLDYDTMKEKVLAEMKKTFRPEFINRIDEIIVFHQLTEEQLRQIVDLLVKDLQERLSDRKLLVELSDKAKSWLVKEGYDPVYGARPLRRAIERYVENPLSSKLLQGEFNEGDTVMVDLGDKGLTFTVKAGVKAGAKATA